jgi:DNA-binding HxlR family transcriptional regulator
MMLRTAQQRKDICATCPIAKVADAVGDSYSILIVRDLLEGPRRFCELEKSLAGISTRTLTNKLKRMLEEELLSHGEDGYVLTEKGAALGGIVDAMRTYGKKYL